MSCSLDDTEGACFENLFLKGDVMISESVEQLVEIGRGWLEYAPPPANKHSPGLSGFKGKINVCVDCGGRILGRGCNLRMLADAAVWGDDSIKCDLCGKMFPKRISGTLGEP